MSLTNNTAMLESLKNYASALANDDTNSIINQLAPVVPVTSTKGFFPVWNDKEAFQVIDFKRVPGTNAMRIRFTKSDTQFDCTNFTAETVLPWQEITDPTQTETIVKYLRSVAITSYEKNVVDTIKSAVTAESGKGVWGADSSTIDPIKQIHEQINTIKNYCGSANNIKVVMGLDAYLRFANNPQVLNRIRYVQIPDLTNINVLINQLGATLYVDGISYGSNKNVTKTGTNVLGSDVFIVVSSDTPTMYDASFAKQFKLNPTSITEPIRVYKEEAIQSDIVSINWNYDLKIVNSYGCKRITTSDS